MNERYSIQEGFVYACCKPRICMPQSHSFSSTHSLVIICQGSTRESRTTQLPVHLNPSRSVIHRALLAVSMNMGVISNLAFPGCHRRQVVRNNTEVSAEALVALKAEMKCSAVTLTCQGSSSGVREPGECPEGHSGSTITL